ncbi:MAG TPA: Calx-beta domain-containing protein [Prolixibacteraceae bacterium]|nr:Calx-beta domain-containing protein [Prolixibacteraceae bacterium]
MKRILNIILLFLAVASFTSCESETIMFDESMSFVAFTTKTTTVNEVNKTLNVPVLVTATAGKPAIEVSYKISVEGHANPAIEGTDFIVISEPKLSYPNGYGYDTIQIKTIDNDEFSGTKTFSIILTSNSLNYDFGALDTILVNLTDDDHPFGWMLGDYSATGILWRAEVTNTWDMVLSPVENDIYTIKILGLVGGGSYGHGASVDFPVYGKIVEGDESYTLTIAVGQEIDSYGFGPCALLGFYGPDGAVDIPTGGVITCDIVNKNGAVSIHPHDEYGWHITSGNNEGLDLEFVVGNGSEINTVWTRK